MAGLDRRYFEIIIMCIANPEAFLSPDVLRTANEVYHVPLMRAEGNRVGALQLPCSRLVPHSSMQICAVRVRVYFRPPDSAWGEAGCPCVRGPNE
jgi:hypothetical protein